MSNIAGKAYAMNLLTPVNTKQSYLSIFIIPGLICLTTSISFFLFTYRGYFHFGIGLSFVLVGTIGIALGVVRWLKIISLFNEYVWWIISILLFIAVLFSSQTTISAIITGLFGLLFLGIAIVLLRLGNSWLNLFIFWLASIKKVQQLTFNGLLTLSLIHYARWVIFSDKHLPRLSPDQPQEKLKNSYMFFFSNFNGSWTQYVDSFSMSIPGGLNLLWFNNVGWKYPVPETPFNDYVISNQIWTEHYYNAYPLATSNDIKSAKKIKEEVINLSTTLTTTTAEDFYKEYKNLLFKMQYHIGEMRPTPVVSLANEAIIHRGNLEENRYKLNS